MEVLNVIRKRDGTPSTVIKVTLETRAKTAPCATCSRVWRDPCLDTPRKQCHRSGYLWYLDLIEFRYRSEEGCKWLMVLTDAATRYYQPIPLYGKSDAAYELRRWIRSMRAHPSYVGFDLYGTISTIHTRGLMQTYLSIYRSVF